MSSVKMSCEPYISSPVGTPRLFSWASRHSRKADMRLRSASVNSYWLTLNLFGAQVCFGADAVGSGRINDPGLQVSQHNRETVTAQRGQSLLEHPNDGDAGRGSTPRDPPSNRTQTHTGPVPEELIGYLASTDPPRPRIDICIHCCRLVVLMALFHDD